MRINHYKKMLVIMGLAFSVSASADIIKKASSHSVKETMDKFETLVKSKGMGVFARVDHTKNAAGVDMKMNDAEVLIFGNPKGGTVIMKKDPAVALDLPLKVAVYKDDAGKVWLSYRNPQDLAKDYDVAEVPVLGKVETALDKLTTAVTK
ncbi:DUF302 domain-containing protein [uncultured Cocleimonas sp.]|uniref:DUF302 domain-containing protein n=1 Tax=uncultured Cocleimonas sp. TaxID=1051587 RepID=UPI0026239BCD|nr:DUF302 domain-containing protein [uncultured Cocleimonas sp.]